MFRHEQATEYGRARADKTVLREHGLRSSASGIPQEGIMGDMLRRGRGPCCKLSEARRWLPSEHSDGGPLSFCTFFCFVLTESPFCGRCIPVSQR